MEDRAYKITINFKYDWYQKELASMVQEFFDKKTGSGTTSKRKLNVTEVIAQKFQRPVIKKFKIKMVGLKIIFGLQI